MMGEFVKVGRSATEGPSGEARVVRLLENLPDTSGGESFEDLLSGSGTWRLERIVSRGTVSADWYDQAWDEWVILLQGEAVIEVELASGGRSDVRLAAGDSVLLPAHLRHRVTHTSAKPDAVWLALHSGEPGAS